MIHRIINIISFFSFVCILISVLVSGCYYDVEERLYPDNCNTENITYNNTVLPVLSRECYGCHDASSREGGVNLEGYDALFEYAANGKFLAAIRHEGSYPMPKNEPKLDSCTIAKIEVWLLAGALEN